MAKHNSIFHVTQLDAYVDRGSFYFNPAADNFEGALETLLVKALEQQVNLEGKVGLVVRVDPPGRWNPNNPYSREMGMDYDLAKDGLGTGLVYFPLLNAGDPIPSRVVQDPTTKDYSNVGWSRCGYVFVAIREELDSLQVPHLSLFSNPSDRLYFVKKLNKPSPSLHIADDPCKKTQKVIEHSQRKKTAASKAECQLNPGLANKIDQFIDKWAGSYKKFSRDLSDHKQKIRDSFNKYLPKFPKMCDPKVFSYYMGQCAAESGFITPFKLQYSAARTQSGLTNSNRYTEIGHIHLATRANHRYFDAFLKKNYPDIHRQVTPWSQNTWKGRNYDQDVCYDLAVLSSFWYFQNHAVVVRGPDGVRLNGGSKLTCAAAVEKYLKEGKDSKFIANVCSTIVNTGGRWIENSKFTPRNIKNNTPLLKRYPRRNGEGRSDYLKRVANKLNSRFGDTAVSRKRLSYSLESLRAISGANA